MIKPACLALLCVSTTLFSLAAQAVTAEKRDYSPATHPIGAASYRKLADEIETHFFEQVLKKWFPACVDRDHGGFYSNFLEDFSRGPRNDKTIVFQSRMTWVAAQVAQHYPDRAAVFSSYARHGVQFLADVMTDQEHGGPYWGLDESGKTKAEWGGEKHAYGIAFCIYAAAAAHAATQDEAALQLAQQTFRWLDQHAHDNKYGGYYEALSREGKVLLRAPGKRDRDLLGTPYGFKSMNSHIHLLEALTALYEVWPNERVEKRLRELHEVVRDKIAVEPGCLNLFFTPDWRAVPDHDSFGHDVETAYLLIEAATALGRGEDAKTHRVARSLVDHGLQYGWDTRLGGFYDRGFAFAPAYGLEKVWWTQAEGLNALLLMHVHHGRKDPRYYAAFLKQWEFIVNYQTDATNGEWYENVNHDGIARKGQPKGTIWKAAYHNGRALMNVSRMLRKLADE